MKNTKKKLKAKKSSDVKAIAKSTAGKKSRNNRVPLYIVLGVLTFLLALTVAVGIYAAYITPQIDDETPFNTPVVDTPDDPNADGPQKTVSADGRKQEKYNLMVVGKDYWSGSTDAIMLVSMDTADNNISVMQIPRDSTVDCGVNENHGKRVNAIYAYALTALRSFASNPPKEYDDPTMAKIAPLYISSLKDTKTAENRKFNDELRSKMALEYLRETLKQTFCIAIDGYVMVDVAGFKEIVDVLGGVEVNVPQNMHYDDDEQNLHIHINKGLQTLDGKKAEGFVRFRYGYVDGDIGRVNAQKIFLAALAKKVMSFSTITKIQPLIETCFEYTTTSLTTTDIIGYVKILLGMDLSNIKFYTAPGEAYQTSSGAWYYSLYMDENLQLINEHFNDYDRLVTENDVTLRQVVKDYNITYNNQGISAEEIEKSELNLTKSDVTYNPTENLSGSYTGGESAQPVSPDTNTHDDEDDDGDDEKDPAVETSSDANDELTDDDTSDPTPDDEQEENTSDNSVNSDENTDTSDNEEATGDDEDLQSTEDDGQTGVEDEDISNDEDTPQTPLQETEEIPNDEADREEPEIPDDEENKEFQTDDSQQSEE